MAARPAAVPPGGFNSRARKRRDAERQLSDCDETCFNSRARKRRDGRYYSIFSCCLNWALFANRDTARHPCA